MKIPPFIASILLLACIGNSGCDFLETITGSGQEAHEAREVASFDGVVIAGSIEAEITLDPDQPQSVEIRGDDNIVRIVRTSVSGGKLVVDLPPRLGIDPRLPLVVTIGATALSHLEANDSAVAVADRVEGGQVRIASGDSARVAVTEVIADESLAVTTSDSARSTLAKVTASGPVTVTASDSAVAVLSQLTAADEVSVHAQDSSDVTLQGQAPSLDATVEDSSHLDAVDLTVSDVALTASDSSDAHVCATRSLDATLSDSSEATYTCDPESVHEDLDDSSTLTET